MSFGYLTTFAYIRECKRGVLSQQMLDERLYIPIKCGYLSFAETPKEKYYDKIMGVTGTLKSLHEQMKQNLSGYNLNIKTFTPSIFGQSNISFQKCNN